MRRALVAFALGCLLTAAPAHAQPSPGIALRWNHCFGEGTGLANRIFACDTNAGFEELIGSFAIGGEDMLNVAGNEIVIDLSTACRFGTTMPVPPSGGPLPEWWKFKNAGTCRQSALGITFAADPENVVCQDWGAGAQVGGIAAYNIDFLGPGTARVIAAVAVPPTALQALSPGNEYYSFTLRISHVKTVGTGACGGCGTPVCIAFNRINVVTDTPANDRTYSGPLNGYDSDFAMWNFSPVPTRAASWGAVKSLYR
jgi:hypothetical protein